MGITDDPSNPRLGHGSDDEPTGMNDAYLVLPEAVRVPLTRPVLVRYIHDPELGGCGTVTTMGRAIAETYATRPSFYGATYCAGCMKHRPVGIHGEFYWVGTERVTWEPGQDMGPCGTSVTANKLKVGT